jgi:hypothetical protein
MEHENHVSKTEEKSGPAPARRDSPTPASSRSGLILDLQRAAGNRAVARMLTTATGGVSGPTAAGPIVPINVQRDEFDAAVKKEMDPSKLDFNKLAKALVGSADNLLKSPDASVKQDSEKKGATADSQTSGTSDITKIPTKEELDKREEALTHEPTAEEQELLSRKERLDELQDFKSRKDKLHLTKGQQAALDKATDKNAALDELADQQKDETDLKARERELRLTPEQKQALSVAPNRKDAIADLEQKKKDDEERKQYMKKLNTPMNPGNKSMKELMGGRSL